MVAYLEVALIRTGHAVAMILLLKSLRGLVRVHKPSVHHTVVVSVRGCCDRCVNTAVGSRTLFFELCRVTLDVLGARARSCVFTHIHVQLSLGMCVPLSVGQSMLMLSKTSLISGV